MAEKKKVVVIGGGVAGSQIAYGLQHVADVTLIDPKEYTEVPYAALRSIVEPKVAERAIILHKDYLKAGKLVQSSAKTATSSEVTTVSGETIPYDYLVITTGTTFDAPSGKVTKAERLQEFKDCHGVILGFPQNVASEYSSLVNVFDVGHVGMPPCCPLTVNAKLLDAESVLIIGGGPVGVELAGEVVTDFPKKKVTLVHAGDRLLEFLGPKSSKKAQKWLQGKGVQVILKDRIDNIESLSPPSYETGKHVELTADAHFIAVGKKVSIKWIEESPFLKERLNVEGRLQVEPTTQVVGTTNVFAAGDVTDFKEMKQGYLASKHAAIVIQNIQKLIKNPDEKKLAVYKLSSSPIGLVSLGRVLAVGQLPFGTVLGRLPGLLKSKDLFVGQSRVALGLKAK